MTKIFADKNRLLIITASCLLLALSGLSLWFYFSPEYTASTVTTTFSTTEEAHPAYNSANTSPTSATVSANIAELSATQPDTEKLPAIPAEMAAQIRQLTRPSPIESIKQVNKDGSVSTIMQTQSHLVTAAVRGPDGQIIIRHGEDFLNNVSEPIGK